MSQGITVTTELPPNPETPTVTYYQSLANDVMKALEQIGVAVPQVDPAQFVSAKITRGKLRVPDQFCITATISAEEIPALLGVGTLNPIAARDALQRLEAFRPVLDKVTAFGKNLKAALDMIKASLASPSLQMYHFAKRLLKDNPTPELQAAVDNLERDLALRRPTRAQKEEKKQLAELKAAANAQKGDPQKKEVPKAA